MMAIPVVVTFCWALIKNEILASHMTNQNGYFNRVIRDIKTWDIYDEKESTDLIEPWYIKENRYDDELNTMLRYLDDVRLRMVLKGHQPDIVDRADHITQYLEDTFVNTENENTHLQPEEPADVQSDVKYDKGDLFFEEIKNEKDSHHSDWILSSWD